jgi:hypothetical protein
MASEADIASVRVYLPTDAEAKHGWDDDKVGSIFDAFGGVSYTVRTYWADRVANTARYVDVNESGSVRSLSAVYSHAVEQLKYWDDVILKETKVSANPSIGFGRISNSRAPLV